MNLANPWLRGALFFLAGVGSAHLAFTILRIMFGVS